MLLISLTAGRVAGVFSVGTDPGAADSPSRGGGCNTPRWLNLIILRYILIIHSFWDFIMNIEMELEYVSVLSHFSSHTKGQ